MTPWVGEIIWFALSIAFFASIVVVLSHADDHPLSEWPLSLTVNTLVALIATICRVIIIVPVEEDLSQLKWNWFAASRGQLKDLYGLDQASRGPWGRGWGICLVPKTRGR